MIGQSWCDWCGEEFNGEVPVAGYDGEPTHKACRRDALRAQRMDSFKDDAPLDREPFTDWPNGQGVYE